jgi:outer membrane protein TolC
VEPPRLKSLIPVGDGAALIQRRPDVRLADRRLASAVARVGVATADLYPRISLTGFYGGTAASTSQLVAEPGLSWGVGPRIAWTFPNQAAPRARVREAKAASAAALASFDTTVLQALKETEKALATYGSELDRREDVELVRDRARRGFEIAEGQFRAGALPTLDLLTAEQTLIAAEAAVAVSDTALVQDQIGLFKALGGGWRTASSTSQSPPPSGPPAGR